MSEAVRGVARDLALEDDEEWQLVERAAAELGFDDPVAFVEEATRRLVGEVLDEDGQLECPHDDCGATFATHRQLRGHLGSSKHARSDPEGEFWCGYCGFGPTTWQGVNAHHGQSSHDGPPVRLDEEPDPEDLIAPDDVPDHQNEALLRRLYREHGGNYTAMCRAHDFDVTPGRVRHYLIEFGIHEVTPQGAAENGEGPPWRDPEWLQERYDAAGGNISEMHRGLDVEVPYRTLGKNLRRFGIHDPTDPPGKRHGKGGPKPATAAPTHDEGGDNKNRKTDPEDTVAPTEPVEHTDAGGPDEERNLDYTDPEDLQEAYDRHDSIAAAAREFPDVSYHTVYHYMKEYGIHSPESYDSDGQRASNVAVEKEEPVADRDVQDDASEPDQPGADADGERDGLDGPDALAEPDQEPPIEWEFPPDFRVTVEQEERSHDRVVGDDLCDRCGGVYHGEGVCESCAADLEGDLYQ